MSFCLFPSTHVHLSAILVFSLTSLYLSELIPMQQASLRTYCHLCEFALLPHNLSPMFSLSPLPTQFIRPFQAENTSK